MQQLAPVIMDTGAVTNGKFTQCSHHEESGIKPSLFAAVRITFLAVSTDPIKIIHL